MTEQSVSLAGKADDLCPFKRVEIIVTGPKRQSCDPF